ncbi:MAG: ABC transporter ATP-binding protein [Chitinophagaceae bacterium]|nr:MAG: ABC transporter ATP-binding protein [Chitinophagaceae bacterium]
MYILSIIRSIYGILNKEQKRRMLFLQIFFAFSAIVQVVGVASIAPFIGIVSSPESIQTNKILAAIYKFGDFQSTESFIIGFALLSVGMIFISNGVNALTLWLQIKFSIYLGCNIQVQLFNNFINRDYLFHKSTNYNKPISIISSDAPRFIYMVLQPYLLMCSQIFVALIILTGLLFMDPAVALGSAIIIGGAYFATYWAVKKSLKRHGDIITARNRTVQALLSEAFIGVKDIKLNSLESKYTNNYKQANRLGLDSNAYILLSGDLPRFAIETVSFGAILVFAIYLLASKSNNGDVVSILSIYALAGYKLLPTMQQIYKSLSNISGNGTVVLDIKKHLDVSIERREKNNIAPLKELNNIELKNICYKYPNTNKPALDNISLTFEKGDLNTIAGPSGSGKSTLADIVLGLLPPFSGSLCADQKPILDDSLFAYQHCIGYVPQHIFILDDSVISNVAFGINKDEVDEDRVRQALTQANAMEFVAKMPNGLATNLGQDGKLLSGGQRQRIGIARALYRSNKVLILDEPTSALDIESEHDLMQLLNQLKHDVLIIVISHRPAAIKLSDKISVIADGNLIAHGDYAELYAHNDYFKSMIEKGFMN